MRNISAGCSGTGAVRVAAVWTLGALRAGVPALTESRRGLGLTFRRFRRLLDLPVFRPVLRVDTFVVDVVEHQAVSAAQLLGGGGELTDDVFSAGSWVREGGVSQRDPVGSNGLALRTLEAVNVGLGGVPLALPGKGGCLLLPDTGALGLVEYQWRWAVVEVGVAMDTVVVSRQVGLWKHI